MKKRVFIIGGWNDSFKEKKYRLIYKYFKEKGYEPFLVNIHWKYKVMTDYIQEFRKIYNDNKLEKNYLFGFSFGSVISLNSSHDLKPDAMILCSLSPYFIEDFKKFPPSWIKRERKMIITDVKNFRFNKICPSVKCKTYLVIGENEPPVLVNRSKDAHRKIKGSKLIIVKGAVHDFGGEKYFNAVKEVIRMI